MKKINYSQEEITKRATIDEVNYLYSVTANFINGVFSTLNIQVYSKTENADQSIHIGIIEERDNLIIIQLPSSLDITPIVAKCKEIKESLISDMAEVSETE